MVNMCLFVFGVRYTAYDSKSMQHFLISAEINGNVGVLHYINDSASLDWLIKVGPHQPYVAMLNSLDFNRFVYQ